MRQLKFGCLAWRERNVNLKYLQYSDFNVACFKLLWGIVRDRWIEVKALVVVSISTTGLAKKVQEPNIDAKYRHIYQGQPSA